MAKKLGCASCGGTKKMKVGGTTSSRAINSKGAGYAKAQVGGSEILKKGVYGMATTNTANAGIATMKKGGVPKAQLGAIVKAAKAGVKAVKNAKAAHYAKATSNLKRVEDWDAYHEGQTAKKVGAAMIGVPVGAAVIGSAISSKSKSKGTKAATGAMSKAFPLKKEQLGGFSEKKAERKITKSIKKSVKNSGKKI